jgi:hypothetical protein
MHRGQYRCRANIHLTDAAHAGRAHAGIRVGLAALINDCMTSGFVKPSQVLSALAAQIRCSPQEAAILGIGA